MNKKIWLIIRNIFYYLILIAGLLFLWSPLNPSPKNQPVSAIQFIYQQF